MSDFFYDDFFVSADDAGIPVDIKFSHGTVTFSMSKCVSLADVEAAKEKAMVKHIKKDGTIELVDVNEGVLAVELLVRIIKSWPFKYRSGKPVPINAATIRALDATASQQLQTIASKMLEQREEMISPLEKPSDEA